MSEQHTSGPWEIDEDGGIYARAQSIVIGQVYDSSDYPCLEGNEADVDAEAQANARLIAAAPELLAALENLYALVQGECPSLLEDDHHDVMVSAAIAKATGR